MSTPIAPPSFQFCIPPNPTIGMLRSHASLNLQKLRSGRNIAGIRREVAAYAAPTDTVSGMPVIVNGQLNVPGARTVRPTVYRYAVLIARAKELVQQAAQVEAMFLGAVEKRDEAAYSLLRARQELMLTQSQVRLQSLRLTEANSGIKLAELQEQRAFIQLTTYQNWISRGLNENEKLIVKRYADVASESKDAAKFNAQIQAGQAAVTAATASFSAGAALAAAAVTTAVALSNANSASSIASAQQDIAIATLNASHERRVEEWTLQSQVAAQDAGIGRQEVTLAKDRTQIVQQEKSIAETQASQARDTIEFLSNRFTGFELYDWMSGILSDVYRSMLQQATAMAQIAQVQLAFERQETPPAIIRADYWAAPISDPLATSSAKGEDRQGLTGSARLLADISQLDQYAFDTNKRKLAISKTISLARMGPVEFQQFCETGVIGFNMPMELFDRDFPGHYLRLIRRVRISVIALTPMVEGIHATLANTGISRVVIGPEIFQTVTIRRDPETVAISAPIGSTGVFEMDSMSEMYLPFEGNGVDSAWEFRMLKAANQFDYRTIADVLITIEYTALNSFDYREQVIQTLKPNLSGDRPFSFRNQFADQWYDLNNPEQTKTPMKVKFQTFQGDFPPNLEALKIQQVLLYFVRANQKIFELPITTLRFTEQGNQGTIGGSATPIDGVISTRRGNAGSWTAMIGKAPVGEWELILPNTEEVKQHFQKEEIDDILLVTTYAGRTPEWTT
jgi:hypothetical protein